MHPLCIRNSVYTAAYTHKGLRIRSCERAWQCTRVGWRCAYTQLRIISTVADEEE